MNIEDISGEELWPKAVEFYGTDNPLEIVFARQRELMEKYLVLEAEILSEKLVVVPVDIHSARGQRALKERIWWAVEEFVEALDAIKEGGETKFLEEMSDALHFLTELLILAGLDHSAIPPMEVDPSRLLIYSESRLNLQILGVIKSLGRAAWQCRNKSWKRTQVLTDVPRLTAHLQAAYKQFLAIYSDEFGLDLTQICLFYLRKSEVNLFRQRSNY